MALDSAAVWPGRPGELFPSRGTACRRAGEPSLERQEASPLYFFKGSRFQCFPGEDKLAQRKKKIKKKKTPYRVAKLCSSGLGRKAVSDLYVHCP